jgi:hypothetical protein
MYQNKPIVIKAAGLAESPPRVILLVDTSGSMSLQENITGVIAERVVAHLPSNVEIGLMFFATKSTPMVVPTSDRGKLTFDLEALRSGDYYTEGVTALWSAVLESVKMFGAPVAGDSIFLISDGGENQSKVREPEVASVLGASGIRLFALILQESTLFRSRTPEMMDGPGIVQAAVRATGGTSVVIGDTPYTDAFNFIDKRGKPTPLGIDMNRQISQLLKFYRVEITLPKAVDKPRDWKLNLSGFSDLVRDNRVFTYPRMLFPCR